MINFLLSRKQSLTTGEKPVRLPILDRGGQRVGALRLLDRRLATKAEVLADLTEWRRRYMRFFLTHFEPSPERTQTWLERITLPSTDRLFFLLEIEPDVFVGNFGVANIQERSAELDNLIRGRRGGGPEFIHLAECAMLWWLFEDPSRQSVCLHVFSNNALTISLHLGVGFKKVKSDPLFIHPNGAGHGYVLEGPEPPAAFSYDEMAITREAFLFANPWVAPAFSADGFHPEWICT